MNLVAFNRKVKFSMKDNRMTGKIKFWEVLIIMKKLLLMMLIAFALFALSACSGNDDAGIQDVVKKETPPSTMQKETQLPEARYVTRLPEMPGEMQPPQMQNEIPRRPLHQADTIPLARPYGSPDDQYRFVYENAVLGVKFSTAIPDDFAPYGRGHSPIPMDGLPFPVPRAIMFRGTVHPSHWGSLGGPYPPAVPSSSGISRTSRAVYL